MVDTAKSAGGVWNEDEVTLSADQLIGVPLNEEITSQLQPLVENLLVGMAINTVSYYMTEFRDDCAQRYMVGHKSFEEKGLTGENDWRDYLESLIHTDEFEVKVLMTPPKVMIFLFKLTTLTSMHSLQCTYHSHCIHHTQLSSPHSMHSPKALLRGRNHPQGGNIKLQYMHKLTPRKIANQIIQVIEHVGNEAITDLRSVVLENQEAMRYAQLWMSESMEVAEKVRN